ncbi:MAG: hypothetical protein ABGZ35_33270, partial [Planctomycetaceae bacterium]
RRKLSIQRVDETKTAARFKGLTAAGTAKTKLTTTTLSVVKHSPGGTIFRAEVGPFYTPISMQPQQV